MEEHAWFKKQKEKLQKDKVKKKKNQEKDKKAIRT